MFTKISTISVPVKDQEAAKDFYVSKLGCRVVEEVLMMPGSKWLQLQIPGVDTTIVLVNWFPQMPPGSLQGVVLFTDDIAKTCAELNARGLATTPIKDQPYGKESTFDDLDGNGWVLEQPLAQA